MYLETENKMNASAENFQKKSINLRLNDFSSENTYSTNNTIKRFTSKPTLTSQKTFDNLRYDAYGNRIIKYNKKRVKVTFIDQLDENNKLVEFCEIPNYKILNRVNSFKEEDKVEPHGCCSCTIF